LSAASPTEPAGTDPDVRSRPDREASAAALVAEAIVGLVVLTVVGALIAIVVVAASSRPPAGASTLVFTVSAPYDPGAHQLAAVPAAATRPAPYRNWTPARGIAIATRALGWVNWPYTWDGGNASGPTYGRPISYDSRNDAHIRGFDCSGLVLNALAPWLGVDHDAAAQYQEAGSLHPALADLQPGDLVFWSKDGTINGIGHVAIYIGGGEVVQAPHSGAYVDVVRLDQVESGKIGLTRPLT
jgi:cell wall-associated NlpC family hydrolase